MITISSAAHADDIRCVSDSLEGLQKQTAIIDNFAKENVITINSSKTELVKFSSQVSITEDVELGSQSLTAQPLQSV